MKPKLQVCRVSFSYHSKHKETLALSDISFTVEHGEFVAILGPSGCGKSTLLSLICGLDEPEAGAIFLDGELLEKNPGNAFHIGYMFQKDQLFEWRDILSNVSLGLEIHHQLTDDRKKELSAMLSDYGLAGFEHAKPSALSGGMRQRVMIAMALAGDPELLIADEPTTALDVTIQAQILDLLKSLQKKLNMSIIIITHDLGVISEMADEVVVMYAGEIVEKAKTRELFDDPKHPYTVGLMNSVPDVDEDVERLRTLEGLVPSLYDMPKGCRFAPRCQFACPECEKERIKLLDLEDGRQVRCRRYEK